MPTVSELRERLRRPLEHELGGGCRDAAVSGGMERLLEHFARPFPGVREALRGYGDMEPEEREAALRRALELLEAGERPTPPPSARRVAGDPQAALGDLVGERGAASKLGKLGLRVARDLLHHYPRRHEDRRVLPDISGAEDGERVTVQGVLTARHRREPRPKMSVVEATLEGPAGAVKVTWFNQGWVLKQLHEGKRYMVTGRAKRFGGRVQVAAEHIEELESVGQSLSIGRIVGVYDATEGVGQDFLRRSVRTLLAHLPEDYLPGGWRARYGLCSLQAALRGIHFPEDEEHLEAATARLRFDEYLFLELRMLLQGEGSVLEGKVIESRPGDVAVFESGLPFRFTGAQRRVIGELARDMAGRRQMARLVQGDVGSGKTAVAACALFLAVRGGYQGALMAPTEILARQHFAGLQGYLAPHGVRVGLLLGAMARGQKAEVYRQLAGGELDVVVGTQALIQDGVRFANLGLAVIDEEHRFGVLQRRKLLADRPDVLVMSATPIPRSLALTAYGDLELSVIDELPPGRTPIQTKLLPEAHRKQAYAFAMNQIRDGRQVYAVTALIEENEELELLAATELASDLHALLPEARIGLLHGKMSAAEKDGVMERFKARDFDLLVSTTVIEVGVDVPNATVMVIENAERFGLSQLHQLRGRVGRGAHESYCVLVAGDMSQKTKKRLQVIENSTDGFVIAEADLRLRGPGEIRGTRQSGLPDLKLGDLASDVAVIEQARELAKHILHNDPRIEHPRLSALKAELQARSAQVAVRDVI